MNWRDPDHVARWAIARVAEAHVPMMLWARAGVFQGPPEWRLQEHDRRPSVGLGWVEVAAIPVERAESAATDWYTLLSIVTQCDEAINGF